MLTRAFNFTIGNTSDFVTGRSVVGCVSTSARAWHLEAQLFRRFSRERVQCNTIELHVARPFKVLEFCFFYTMLSTENFEVNADGGRLRACDRSKLPIVKAIKQDGFRIPEVDFVHEGLKADITRLEERLSQILREEKLEAAAARRLH